MCFPASTHVAQQKPDRRRTAMKRLALTITVALTLCGFAAAQAPPPQTHKVFGNPLLWQWAPSRTYHVDHYKLALHFNQAQGEIFGDETVTLTPFGNDFRQFDLDSSGLSIDSVTLAAPDGSRETVPASKLQFIRHDPRLTILLDKAYSTGARLAVHIVYHGFPRTGLFFINPDKNYPNNPKEIWSQGEPEDNHYWYPSWDYPNDKATSETIITVPEGQVAVSNGKLVSVQTTGGQTTYHWVESVPHSSYLNSVAVGPWLKVEQHYKNVPVDSYVVRSVGRDTALRSFGLTPDMIAFYAQRFGVEYPYEKYAQTAVFNFTEGGMENISATTQTDWTLHDQRADADYPSTSLVAHELAHQWFGDLVTTRDWANIWLNEGFATFIADLYTEHHEGEDAYRFGIYKNQMSAQNEDNNRYRRPIVDHHYEYPMQMFDSTTYPKGAAVLDMMRYVLGDKAFFDSLHHYLTARREKNADTADLMQAIRETSGQNLDWFFHEWLFLGGYPEYKVRAQFDEASHMESISVEQTQKPDAVTPIFDMPVELAFYGPNGEKKTMKVRINLARQNVFVPLDFRPLWVDFDPHDRIDKTLDFEKPATELVQQAEHDPAMMSRLWAVQELGTTGKADPQTAIAALQHVLQTDTFKGVRAAAATSLGKIGGDSARTILLATLQDKENDVRAAAAEALTHFPKDPQVYDALVDHLHNDPSYLVEATSARALGHLDMPQAFDVLKAEIESNPEIHVAAGALVGLTQTKHSGALDVLLQKSQPGVAERERIDAMHQIAQLKDQVQGHEQQINELIREGLSDNFSFVQAAAIRLVGDLKLDSFKDQLVDLESSLASAPQRDVVKQALEQLAGGPAEAQAAAAPKIEDLQRQIHDLSQKVQQLERQSAQHP